MLFLILLTTAFFQGIITSTLKESESNLCEKDPFVTCKFESKDKFPESAEDVDDLCEDLVPFHHCISEFLRNCDTDEANAIPYRGIFDFGVILLMCNKESPLYRVVVDNIKCMGGAIQRTEGQHFCSTHLATLMEETPDIIEKMQLLVTGDTAEISRELENCLETVFEVGCIATALSNSCGQDALSLYLWLVEKSRLAKDVCHEEHETVIEEFVQLMKFEFRK
ncbi:uncharacterized protein [Parasteatoda tepidariorum]|uniref:uncharacterized protein isoform X2 n=1 Tax=Parasteatoda tepidariorum TaxID=114398 RepID=UPI00077FB8A0|nr:uncharacterized protein LOC107454661 isoform X2 [Parasteatoda tepidariorum]XP_015927417.1 uncharacterized protein LOC107454661 isoform X3 [Parasteatoda tepidariorum]